MQFPKQVKAKSLYSMRFIKISLDFYTDIFLYSTNCIDLLRFLKVWLIG